MLNPDRGQLTTYSYILAGLVTVIGIFRLMSYNDIGIRDGMFLACAGLALFAVARMVGSRKVFALYLSGLIALASLWFSLQFGRFNVLLLTAAAAIWTVWLNGFRKNGEIK